MAKKKHQIIKPQPKLATVSGRFEQSKSGIGFVIINEKQSDILIRPEHINHALHGDDVVVDIIQKKKGGRLEGIIKRVEKRNQSDFTGVLQVSKDFAFMMPDNDKMKFDIFIPIHQLNGAKDGDFVVATITDWPAKAKNPVGKVKWIFSAEDQSDRAMQSTLIQAGFPLEFSEAALAEANKFSDQLDADEVARRRDFRDILTLTIDPLDAKDFDDAISFKPIDNEWYEIGVHIADVSYYMKPGGALDSDAYERATSVYLPDRVLPMLPEHLSNFLCSLRPNEEKFAFSAVFEMNTKGKVRNYWLGRTVIKSNRRFTYEEAQERIMGDTGDYYQEILVLNTMAQNMRAERMKHGAINFSSEEVRFVLDEKGKPVGITIKVSKEAHQLIEELMLLANRTVAEHVSKIKLNGEPLPFPYRIHDVPDEDKLKMFTTFAYKYGHHFDTKSSEAIAASFNSMLQLVEGKPEQHVLETLGIRTMAKAVYSTENIGHYGLGFKDYCHFTSPIRRYPDVLVHRIVQEVLNNHPIAHKELEEQCKHCSDQERKAMEAERSANKYKQVEFLQDHIGEEFEAVVSGIAAFGFWAETVAHKCEGLVPMQDLSSIDYFRHDPNEYALIGETTGLVIRMGDTVQIKVAAANLEKRQLDYTLVALSQDVVVENRPRKSKKETKPYHKKSSSGKHKK